VLNCDCGRRQKIGNALFPEKSIPTPVLDKIENVRNPHESWGDWDVLMAAGAGMT
jgi:hypothetical protein